MKKILSLIISLTMLLSLVVPTQISAATQYKEVKNFFAQINYQREAVPKDKSVAFKDNNRVILFWEQPNSQLQPKEYEVAISANGKKSKLYKVEADNNKEKVKTYLIPYIKFNTKYKATVYAVYKNDKKIPKSITFKTGKRSDYIVNKFKVVKATNNSIKIKWNKIKFIKGKYQIEYSETNDKKMKLNKSKDTKATLKNLKKKGYYNIFICAYSTKQITAKTTSSVTHIVVKKNGKKTKILK